MIEDRQPSSSPTGSGTSSALRWVPLLVLLALAGAMVWAKSRDPFQRVPIKLKLPGGKTARGMAVWPKPARPYPVVVYLHGSGGTLAGDGHELRQLAELGLAAVGLDYDQANQPVFEQQFQALLRHIRQQPWARSNATAWVGFSLGAQRALSFLLKNPEDRPQLLVRLSGGWLPELDATSATLNPQLSSFRHTPILLVHGERDEVYPAQDARRWADLLRSHGVSVTAHFLPDRFHTLEPDRELVFRLVGEYCRSSLTPGDPFRGQPGRRALPLWLCLLPAGVGGALLVCLRRHKAGGVGERSSGPRPRRERVLRWLAWVVAALAIGQTGINVLAPRLPVTADTLNLARRWLVPAHCQTEFASLSTNQVWRGQPLQALLDGAALANYNRGLVNWKVEEPLYLNFVLPPDIGPGAAGELNWRRPLWEHFYPRIRREETPEAAAQIVVRFLRERVTITTETNPPPGILTAWQRQWTDANGFDALYVAALRSVGIPARRSADGKADYWTGGKWTAAPRPMISSFASSGPP